MSIRPVVTISAVPGKGSGLAQAYKARCAEAAKEPGCEQFEIFQSVANPDRLALLERWVDQAALDAHARLNSTRRLCCPSCGSDRASVKTTSTTGRGSRRIDDVVRMPGAVRSKRHALAH